MLLIALSARFASAAHTEPAPGAIDLTVSRIETGGAWGSGTRHGHYRAVVQTRCSVEHCRDRLFVQWMAEAPRPQLAATKFISEVGDLTHITEVRFLVGTGGTKLEVHHQADGTDEKWIRCVTLGAEGQYVQSEGACARGD